MSYRIRYNEGGNFCGHDPENPRFAAIISRNNASQQRLRKSAFEQIYPVAGKGGIPSVLADCASRIRRYYARPGTILPMLNFANQSDRQQRSERREACVSLLECMLVNCNLVTLRVGFPGADGFVSYTIEYLARRGGLTLSRASRALSDLKAAGLLTVTEVAEKQADGNWLGKAAVKCISRHLFSLFGISLEKLERERKKAAARERFKRPSAEKTSPDRQKLLFPGLLNQQKKKRDGSHVQNQEFERQLSLIATELKLKNPHWPRNECFEAAKKQLSH